MSPREPQHGEDAAADPVEHARRHGREVGDQVVRAAQLLIATVERFRNVHERRDPDEIVAGHRQREANPRLAQRLGPLVGKAVVDAAADLRLLRLLEQPIRREIDSPILLRARFGEAARRRRVERLARGLANISLGQASRKSRRRSVPNLWRRIER